LKGFRFEGFLVSGFRFEEFEEFEEFEGYEGFEGFLVSCFWFQV
jgi:hypothetical protein